MKWGFDPAAPISTSLGESTHEQVEGHTIERKKRRPAVQHQRIQPLKQRWALECHTKETFRHQRPVWWLLLSSSISSKRALVVLFISVVYGLVYSSQEPSIPSYLADVWGFDPGKVGLRMFPPLDAQVCHRMLGETDAYVPLR
ncbi:hypothetical protein BDN72DRAFT_4547 [Pluteus cervinus]|uniref:Uncharacterized protein n=1 Tax=Pluteus cervinus TaxID=181527 RepID=A0ACD3BF91_9AGAR|nr:hypothetical protein BDN72DRAFT_4547 [Pluteus cervinus]